MTPKEYKKLNKQHKAYINKMKKSGEEGWHESEEHKKKVAEYNAAKKAYTKQQKKKTNKAQDKVDKIKYDLTVKQANAKTKKQKEQFQKQINQLKSGNPTKA